MWSAVWGTLTYDAWSQPADPAPTSTTTTAVPPETEVPPVTPGDQATTPSATAVPVSRTAPTRSTDEVTTGIP